MTIEFPRAPRFGNNIEREEFQNGYQIIGLEVNGEKRWILLEPNQALVTDYPGKMHIKTRKEHLGHYTEEMTEILSGDGLFGDRESAFFAIPVSKRTDRVRVIHQSV